MAAPLEIPDRLKTTDEYYASEQPDHRRYLLEYHVQLCECQDPVCLHAHSAAQLRRVPMLTEGAKWNYFPHKCKQGTTCSRVLCSKSHNDDEVKYHPTVYKTKQCAHPLSPSSVCVGFGLHCPFAHSSDDLRYNSRFDSPVRSVLPKVSAPPLSSFCLELLQGQAELERLRRLVLCGNCGQAEKEWRLDCGHLLCAKCGPREQKCPNCGQPVRTLRAVRLV